MLYRIYHINTQFDQDSYKFTEVNCEGIMGDIPITDACKDFTPSSFKEVLKEHGYIFTKELSGTVYLVNNTDRDAFVIKQIDLRHVELATIQNQVETWKTLSHPYMVLYEDSFEDKKAGHYYVVTEFCAGGDLCKKMQAQTRCFDEQQILDWLVQICLALQHLHEKDVLYREIHPQDVFLTEDGYINIGGLLKRDDTRAVRRQGATSYFSPECYLENSHIKSDIWSLGWLLHDLCMLNVWSNTIERNYLHANSMKGNPPPISDEYSKDLRELIEQMLSRDPKDRPSAVEILAKEFLSDARKRNLEIPEALKQRLMKSIDTFNQAYSDHYRDLEILVGQWGETIDSIESIHYKATAGSLSGSVIGAAGGITALVGAILAPFTFGASLIVTGVGIGVGVAGGVTGATSSVINSVQQKSLREKLQKIEQDYKKESEPIFTSMGKLKRIIEKIKIFEMFRGDPTFDKAPISWDLGKGKASYFAEIMNLGVLVNVSRIAAQSAKVGRVAAAAVSGVISGLLILLDVAFIVQDSKEIHKMRRGDLADSENVSSTVLKSIIDMKKTHAELCKVLNVIKETKEALQKEECTA